ncbi:MAG: aquaporin family protein [Asticcacaulis sp.]|nr:aquaporin family protein [Asticcacaulis sp.]
MPSLNRRLFAEFIGTLLLLATVVGSGIMAQRLAAGNDAVALLGNTLATGAMLVVLITMLGPISGAHFNPAVTLIIALRREIKALPAIAYVVVQIIGAIAGVWLAHAMFGEAIVQISQKVRSGPAQALSEAVATFGLILTIFATHQARRDFVPVAVGLYITGAYWFTASTSFANPAVTLARSLSDTFAGIRPADAPAFILAQIVGALLALAVCTWFLKPSHEISA